MKKIKKEKTIKKVEEKKTKNIKKEKETIKEPIQNASNILSSF